MAGRSRNRPDGDADEQGRRANQNGQRLKDDVALKLLQCGYERHPRVASFWRGAPYFVPHYKSEFCTMYGAPLTVDFLLWHPDKHPKRLLLATKYQSTSGSIDEKFPYLVTNLKDTGVPALLLVIGGAAKPHGLAWLKAQQTPDFTVLTSWEAFAEYANKGKL